MKKLISELMSMAEDSYGVPDNDDYNPGMRDFFWEIIDELQKYQWKPIEGTRTDRKMVLITAKYPGKKEWADPQTSWFDERTCTWPRWWHIFPPTHYCEIPELDNVERDSPTTTGANR